MLFGSKVPIFMELFNTFINNKESDKYEKKKYCCQALCTAIDIFDDYIWAATYCFNSDCP